MTCAQGLLRLLWGGGPEVGMLRDWLWFHVDIFLNLVFYYNAVEYRHKYHNTQLISMRKILAL